MGPITLRWIRSNYQAHVLVTPPQIPFLSSGFRDQDKDKHGCSRSMVFTVQFQSRILGNTFFSLTKCRVEVRPCILNVRCNLT